jgi:NAD(P)-dependent dehydrogenase (short-subunit alcohol dehydrogenase family)
VTGGSRGLGYQMVLAFAAHGADVVVTSRKLEACEKVAAEVRAMFRLMSLVGSRMAAGEGGSIINISSAGALRPRPQIAPYAGAKAALNAITEAFAFEYGPKVRVNTISPGRFLTDVSKAWSEEHKLNSTAALRRSGRPEEIVTAALYLASSKSSFTTGSVVRVDGGIA